MDRRAVQVGVLVGLVAGVLMLLPAGLTHNDRIHYLPPAKYHNVLGGALTPAGVRAGLTLALAAGLIAGLTVRAVHVRRALSRRTRNAAASAGGTASAG